MCVKNVVKRVLACVLLCLPVCMYAEWPEYPGTEGVTGSYYVLEVSGEQQKSTIWEQEYDLNGPGSILTFSAKSVPFKVLIEYTSGDLRVDQYVDGKWSNLLSEYSPKNKYKDYSLQLDKRATKIKFYTETGATGYKYIKDIKVSMAQYVEDVQGKTVDFGLVYFNARDMVQTFVMDWCNTNALAYSLESDADNQFEVWIENNAEMGKYGTAKVNVRYKHSVLGEHSATLTIDGKVVMLHGITKGEQRIRWSQNLMGYIAAEDGTIDEATLLTAYAVDSLGQRTDVAVQYIIDDTDMAEVVDNGDGTYSIHIKAVGITNIHATTVESDIYATATAMREVRANRNGEPCGTLALYAPDEQSIFTINVTDAIPLTGEGDQLTFEAYRQLGGVNYFYVQYSIDNGTNWSDLENPALTTSYAKYGPYAIPEGTTHIRFATKTGATLRKYIRYVQVTQKSYLTTTTTEVNVETLINRPFSDTIRVQYSDVPLVQYSLTQHHGGVAMLVPQETVANNCGDYGVYTFVLKGNALQPLNCKDTIVFRTADGRQVEVPVTLNVALDDTLSFDVEEGDWSKTTLWTYNMRHDHGLLPTAATPVEIAQPVTITTHTEAYSILLRDGGKITIASTGGLTVYAGGITGANKDNLIIESNSKGAGFFRMSPAAETAMPEATVLYTTKSTLDTGVDKDATWQYVGAPAAGVYFDKNGRTWISRWDEQQGWIEQTGAFDMVPFAGYTITQYGQPTYALSGQLINGNHDIVLSHKATGDNVFANSYVAPIDVKNFTVADFDEGIERTFYLFNAGSWNQWNAGESDSTNLGGNGDNTPGHYGAIPVLLADKYDSRYDITTIPPMQGVYVIANTDGAMIHLDYEKHVWNAQGARMNEPMRAQRHGSDVAERRLRVQVNSSYSGADRIYLFEDTLYSEGYDNGYDAIKQVADGLANLYISASFGKAEVAATDHIDSTYVGFAAGEDDNYVLTFTSLIGDSLYLQDTENDSVLAITEGGRYVFYATPKTDNSNRFRVLTERPQKTTPTVPTDVPVSMCDTQQPVALYTIGGVLLRKAANGAVSTTGLPAGVYILRNGNTSTKVVHY